MSVDSSVIIYVGLIWVERATSTQETKMKLALPQRQAALKLIHGYKMVSGEAAYVLARTTPVDIVSNESAGTNKKLLGLGTCECRRKIRKQEHGAIVDDWQRK